MRLWVLLLALAVVAAAKPSPHRWSNQRAAFRVVHPLEGFDVAANNTVPKLGIDEAAVQILNQGTLKSCFNSFDRNLLTFRSLFAGVQWTRCTRSR